MAVGPEDALRGWQARAAADPSLRELLGARPSGNARIEEGFPVGPAVSEAEPARATYFLVTDEAQLAGLLYTVRLQLDIFVWPGVDGGGSDLRRRIDERFLALFANQQWHYGAAALYAYPLAGRNYPSAPEEALRKTRDWTIRVSPAVR